jgi:hypothetical protein
MIIEVKHHHKKLLNEKFFGSKKHFRKKNKNFSLLDIIMVKQLYVMNQDQVRSVEHLDQL